MRIFLSYASEDRAIAERISLALSEQGHRVFFDRSALPAGDEFHARIRRGIEASQLFVFLVSAHALDAGSYTLNELDIARSTWPDPAGRVLPVLLEPIDMGRVPNYLKAVTLLGTEGDVTASVVDSVYRMARARRRAAVRKLSLGAACVAVVAIGVAVYLATRTSPDEVTGKDGVPERRVPAGAFTMGDDSDMPRRQIYTDAFYIDKFEVTTGRYARFLKATGSVRAPQDWDDVDLTRSGDVPVVGVDWSDADAYCRWAGKRLPTEAEWEKAARGTDGRLFPWGNEMPTTERANFGNSAAAAYEGGLARVGSHPAGRSPSGVQDMAGNAAEWVTDWYTEIFSDDDVRNPKGPNSGAKKVIRGGGWSDPAGRIAATKRYFADPGQRSDDIGFRCAR